MPVSIAWTSPRWKVTGLPLNATPGGLTSREPYLPPLTVTGSDSYVPTFATTLATIR